MKHMVTKLAMVAAMLSLSVASAQAVEFKGVVGLGYDAGGDTLATVTFTDGSTSEVKANAGLLFNGGVVIVTGDFETQATVGYKFDSSKKATNVNVTFDVLPVELMEFYRTDNLRMGLGLSYHSSPTLKIDFPGNAAHGTYKFKDAIGYVAQIGWSPRTGSYSIDLRYTAIKYLPNYANPAKAEYNGNSVGLGASFYF
ncbi:MAG: hypothetical protein WC236_04160 [Gallionellaceae bacterium]|jgi:hypothetical protein